jgi:putative transposase
MKIIKAYKTELKLNNKQTTNCLRHAGTARVAFNWGLARRIAEYEATGKSSSCFDQQKQLNALKKTDFPWMYDVSKCAPQEALRDLDKAYANFFRRCKAGGKPGFPHFKSRHRSKKSFRLTGTIKVFDSSVQLPVIGKVKLKRACYIPTNLDHILSATIPERAGRWFFLLLIHQINWMPY